MSCKSHKEDNKKQPEQKGQRPSPTQLISELDSNSDNKLSKNEAKGPLINDFSKIDANNDGFLTAKELENAPMPSPRGQGKRDQGNRPPKQENLN